MARTMRGLAAALALGALAAGAAASAQPADLPVPAATTGSYPPGVTVVRTPAGPVYADAKGRTLYGMDMRVLLRWAPNPAFYCRDACAKLWEPLLAPPGSAINIMFPRGFGERPRPGEPPAQGAREPGQAPLPQGYVSPQRAPDWTVIEGPAGPQWVYKGWHMVYVRKGDKPGSTRWDGAEGFAWNTLKFVPPVPRPSAPPGIAARFADGAYVLADKEGRLLFAGTCAAPCGWTPLAAPMAARGGGDWAVSAAGDAPQWTWRGKPVWLGEDGAPPPGGEVLRP